MIQMPTCYLQLVEIIGSGLEGQEYVTVLSWVIQTYPGKELMADLSLGIPQSKVKPLLDAETVIRLQASIHLLIPFIFPKIYIHLIGNSQED